MRLDDSGPACTDTVKEALIIAEHKWETEEGRKELADLFAIDMSL